MAQVLIVLSTTKFLLAQKKATSRQLEPRAAGTLDDSWVPAFLVTLGWLAGWLAGLLDGWLESCPGTFNTDETLNKLYFPMLLRLAASLG